MAAPDFAALERRIKKALRQVSDFPRPGIQFYDVTSLLLDARLSEAIRQGLAALTTVKADALVAVEARGFIFGAFLASSLGLPLVLARKPGKLPGKQVSIEYPIEYGRNTICLQKDDLKGLKSVILCDDLAATGNSIAAVAELLQDNGVEVSQFVGVLGLPALHYRDTILQKGFNFPVSILCDLEGE